MASCETSPSSRKTDMSEEAALTANVSTALAVASGFDASHIAVSVEQDEIVLTGLVATKADLASAIIVAETTASDHTVRNRIVVAQSVLDNLGEAV